MRFIWCPFFIAEYLLRLACAPGAPGGDDRAPWRARLGWTCSIGGVFDFRGALSGILNLVLDVPALIAGILATAFAQEIRRHAFLRTWNIIAKVPFFTMIGAAAIAEAARLLRPRDYPAGAVIVRRGEPGDCTYFIASGEVEVEVEPRSEPLRLQAGEFFGEIASLTGAARIATVVATQACTLLRLDIVDFRELIGRQSDLARIIL